MKISNIIHLLAITAACTAPLALTSCGSDSSSSSSSGSNNELMEPFTMTLSALNKLSLSMTPTTETEGRVRAEVIDEEDITEIVYGSYIWLTPPSADSTQAVIKITIDGVDDQGVIWEVSLNFSSDTEAFGNFKSWLLSGVDGSIIEEGDPFSSDILFSRKLY